ARLPWITQASYVLPAGARGSASARAASPLGATATPPALPIDTSFAPGCDNTDSSGSFDVESVEAQIPSTIAAQAATAAAAASGAVQLRLRRWRGTTFGRSLRACVRIRSFSSGGGATEGAP